MQSATIYTKQDHIEFIAYLNRECEIMEANELSESIENWDLSFLTYSTIGA